MRSLHALLDKKMIHDEKKTSEDQLESHAHHSGILRAMLAKAVSNRFSSKPIDIEKHKLEQAQQGLLEEVGTRTHNSIRDVSSGTDNRVQGGGHPTLTLSEQTYLETLLESEDHDSIRQATLMLSDHTLFPREDQEKQALARVGENLDTSETALARRDSEVQRLLFRMHEIGRLPGKKKQQEANGRRRLGWNERKECFLSSSIDLESEMSVSSLLEDHRCNSVLLNHNVDHEINNDNDNESGIVEKDDRLPSIPADRSSSGSTNQDIPSWLDGRNAQIESAKRAAESFFKTSFAILGTAANDVSCQPHVLSPPLMESLLEFVPETLSDYHFWIKYSMVRDGANIYALLRHTRASTRTILAIETTEGAVFGAFTSSPWRFVTNLLVPAENGQNENESDNVESTSFYGSRDSFLWKMKQSRFDSQRLVRSSTVEQAILMESELTVFPYNGRNNCVQHCGTEDGIGMGEHMSALKIDSSLRSGFTGSSETFGNPCLIDPKENKVNFQVANLEVWTLTPYDNVKDAEEAELTTFFQRDNRGQEKSLNVFNILVGGPKL